MEFECAEHCQRYAKCIFASFSTYLRFRAFTVEFLASFLASFYKHFSAKQQKWSKNEVENEPKIARKWLPWTTLMLGNLKKGERWVRHDINNKIFYCMSTVWTRKRQNFGFVCLFVCLVFIYKVELFVTPTMLIRIWYDEPFTLHSCLCTLICI